MNKINIDDIDTSEDLFFVSIDSADISEMILVCSFWRDEIEELYGDQVSAINVVGYFDQIESVEAWGANGFPINPPKDLLEEAKAQLKNVELEIERRPCKVDYSPQYYDLI
tara:strand:+ start:156 stop:488 length:333 start_codon:yes stop_codon:yes gene_type:complete